MFQGVYNNLSTVNRTGQKLLGRSNLNSYIRYGNSKDSYVSSKEKKSKKRTGDFVYFLKAMAALGATIGISVLLIKSGGVKSAFSKLKTAIKNDDSFDKFILKTKDKLSNVKKSATQKADDINKKFKGAANATDNAAQTAKKTSDNTGFFAKAKDFMNEKLFKKPAQETTEKAAQETVDTAVQKATEKTTEKATEKAAQETAEKATEKAAEKAAQETAEKAAQESSETFTLDEQNVAGDTSSQNSKSDSSVRPFEFIDESDELPFEFGDDRQKCHDECDTPVLNSDTTCESDNVVFTEDEIDKMNPEVQDAKKTQVVEDDKQSEKASKFVKWGKVHGYLDELLKLIHNDD